MDSPLEVEPGFEPQQRARSNTWPLPRPDNYPDGDEVVVGGGAMGGPAAGGGVMQEGPPPLVASAGGGSAVPVGVSPGVGVAGGVPPGGLPKKNSSRRNAWGNMSYADLITQAIQSAPDKRLTLSQIYEWMVQNVPYFKDKGDSNSSAGWKNSIRHNLSLHNRFMRVQNEGTGKSSWWMINPDAKPGKSARRRAASMETSKFEKRRGRARKKVEALRSAAAAVAATQPTEHHGGPPHHQQHHGILHGGQPATPSPASSLSESLDLFIESPPPPPIPLQAPGTPAASPFGPPDFRPRASSNASSCGGRLSPIPALDSDSSPLPPRWENGEYSPYDRYATEQLAGNLAEGMKIEEAYLAAQQMRHNGFGEQQSPGSPFPPPPPPPPAYEAYHHHHHHHQQHHQRHPMSGHLAHLPMRHGGRQQQQQQEVEMVAYHGMAPSGCQLHPHQQCGCPRPMEATPVDGGIQGHCEAMSPGLSPSHMGQNGGYSPTEAQASVPPPPPPPPPLPPATSSSCTSPPAGAVASPASASSPSAPASGALLAASRSPATSVSPSASPATASAGLPAPSPSEERDVEERRRGGVVVGGGCGSRGGMRGNHHAGSRTPTPSQMMGQLIGVLNNNTRNNNNNEEYLSQPQQPHYNYQVQQAVTGGSFQQHLVDDFSINIETLHGGFDCNVDEVIKHELSMDGSLDFNFCQQQQQQQHQQHQQQMQQLQHQLHPHHHHPGHPVQHHHHQQQHHHHHHHQQLHLVQHHIQEGHLGHSFQPHHAFHPHLLQGGGVPGGGGGAAGGGVGHGGEQDLLGGHHATAGAAVGQQGVVPFVTTVATGPSWVH